MTEAEFGQSASLLVTQGETSGSPSFEAFQRKIKIERGEPQWTLLLDSILMSPDIGPVSGQIVGNVTRSCFVQVPGPPGVPVQIDANGAVVPQEYQELDAEWSSAFCAQFK